MEFYSFYYLFANQSSAFVALFPSFFKRISSKSTTKEIIEIYAFNRFFKRLQFFIPCGLDT